MHIFKSEHVVILNVFCTIADNNVKFVYSLILSTKLISHPVQITGLQQQLHPSYGYDGTVDLKCNISFSIVLSSVSNYNLVKVNCK